MTTVRTLLGYAPYLIAAWFVLSAATAVLIGRCIHLADVCESGDDSGEEW